MAEQSITHIHLTTPYNGETDFYFGSLKAAWDFFPPEVLKTKYTSVVANLRGGDDYATKKYQIKRRKLITKKQQKIKNNGSQVF